MNRTFEQPILPKGEQEIQYNVTPQPTKLKISDFQTITSLSGFTYYVPVIGGNPINDYKITTENILSGSTIINGILYDITSLQYELGLLTIEVSGNTSSILSIEQDIITINQNVSGNTQSIIDLENIGGEPNLINVIKVDGVIQPIINKTVDIASIQGEKGDDGYTPIKNVDYFDGVNGTNGTNGLDGSNGVDGLDGYTPVKGVDYFDGTNGIDGSNGLDGYTPVKGVDYFDGLTTSVNGVQQDNGNINLQPSDIGAQPSGTYSTDIHANIQWLDQVSGTNSGDQTDIIGNAATATELTSKYNNWGLHNRDTAVGSMGWYSLTNHGGVIIDISESNTGGNNYWSGFDINLDNNTPIHKIENGTGTNTWGRNANLMGLDTATNETFGVKVDWSRHSEETDALVNGVHSVFVDASGSLHVGNIVQSGSTYETHAEQIYSTSDKIIMRDGAVAGLSSGETVGFTAKLYDGVNDGQLVFDRDGYARVGDVGDLKKIAVIEETPTDGYVMRYDNTNKQIKSYSPYDLPLNNETSTALGNKVDKEVGKGLSTNDFTHEQKEIYGNTVSTGWVEPISITSGDTTHININSAEGFIVYNTNSNSENPIITEINFSGSTNVLLTNISTSDITYFLVDINGQLYQQTTYPTPNDRRDNLFIGRVSHPNRTSILALVNTPDFATSPMSQLRDMFDGMKLMNNGISVYADGANLGFNISGGKLTGLGINGSSDIKNPNQVTIAGKVPASFYYRTQTGGATGLVSVLTPGFYDVGGTITAISTGGDAQANRSTNIRIYQFSNGNVVCQYGQTVYSSLSLAVAGIPTEQFVQFSNVKENAILIGIISVRRAATVLNNTSFAIFTPSSMFGEVTNSTNGTSITDLQGIYGNSSSPEFVTDSTRGALTGKAGTGNDGDNIYEVQNGAGIVKWEVDGSGNVLTFPDYGAETAGTMNRADWTLTSGWDSTNVSDTMLDKNAAGTTTATLIGGIAPVIGTSYKIVFTVGDSISGGAFVGNVTPSFGSSGYPAITVKGTYSYVVRATSVNKIVFTPSTTGARFSISSLSILPITTSTAKIQTGGDFIFGSRFLTANGVEFMYPYPNGDVVFPVGTVRYGGLSGGSIAATSTITGRQLATTTGTAATTTGAITFTLSTNGNYYLSAALTGAITMNITAPVAGGVNKLFFKQGATAQTVTLSLTGVTWNQTGGTTTGTNTLSITGISTVNAFYTVELNWVSTTVCFVTVK